MEIVSWLKAEHGGAWARQRARRSHAGRRTQVVRSVNRREFYHSSPLGFFDDPCLRRALQRKMTTGFNSALLPRPAQDSRPRSATHPHITCQSQLIQMGYPANLRHNPRLSSPPLTQPLPVAGFGQPRSDVAHQVIQIICRIWKYNTLTEPS